MSYDEQNKLRNQLDIRIKECVAIFETLDHFIL